MHSPVSPTTDACSSSQGSPRCSAGSPSFPVSELTIAQQASPSRSEATFICTICWQHQPCGSKPKLLGTSARIVCHPCWRAVLDLSICWVCGECIVRGDEVVSLGWCFWHRGCFGCLICRTRINIPQSPNHSPEWGKWDGAEDDGIGRRRTVGIELDTIPLCNVCTVETAAESQGQVLNRGLECVTLFDGGLSRDRLDMLTDERESEMTLARRHLVRTPRRLRGVTGIEQDLKRYINCSSSRFTNDLLNLEDMSSLLDNAADMGQTADGSMDNEHQHSQRTMTNSDLSQGAGQTDAYVSVFNPVGEPAFRPGKFKPLPSWMNLLPNNVQRGREQKSNAVLEHSCQHLPERWPSIEDKEPDSSDGSEDFPRSPIALVDIPSLRGGGKATLPMNNGDKSRKQRAKRTILFETGYGADDTNDNEGHQCPRRVHTPDSVHSTPPEYSSYHPPQPRRRTPYPQDLLHVSTLQKDSNAYFLQSKSSAIAEEPVDEPCCELGSQLQQRKNVRGDKLLPKRTDGRASPQAFSLSSEYLDKYLQKSRDAEKKKNTATRAEPTVDKSKREKRRKRKMAKGIKDSAKNKRAKGEMRK